MLTCGECGQDGACFCPENDELDCGVGDRYHALCYARKGITVREDCQHRRRHSGHRLPPSQRASLPSVRYQSVRMAKPKPLLLYRL